MEPEGAEAPVVRSGPVPWGPKPSKSAADPRGAWLGVRESFPRRGSATSATGAGLSPGS